MKSAKLSGVFLYRISWTARVRVGKYSRRMQEYNGACYQVNKKKRGVSANESETACYNVWKVLGSSLDYKAF